MTRRIALSVLGLLVLAGVAAGVAAAQTTAPPPTTTTTPTSADDSSSGAYDTLSSGNRKIARALFEGQKADGAPGAKTLSRDDIAARKQNGEGWGVIFKDMKSQGLVEAKNLGELVSRSNHGSRHSGVVTTASGRTVSDGNHGHGSKGPKRFDGDAAAVSGRSNSGHGGGFAHGGGSSGSSHGSGSGHGRSGGYGHGRGK